MDCISSLSYRSFVLDKGWCDWVETGKPVGSLDHLAGITCFELKFTGEGRIQMQSYIQDEGWSRIVHNDEVCGDSTQTKKIQAIRLKLIEIKGYHIFYRVCFEHGEWSHWKRDNEVAGDIQDSHYIVSLEIRLVLEEPHLSYRAYIRNLGWSEIVGDNQIVGSESEGLRIEALWAHYSGPGIICFQGYSEDLGWLPEVENDMVCGTVGKGLRLQAFRMTLHDFDNYHIYYCIYLKGMGWQSWVKDGEIAGLEDQVCSIEAIRIRIAP